MIEAVKYGDNPSKDELVELIKITNIRFEKTAEFTRNKWNHYQEYLYLYILPQKMALLQNHLKYISKICNEIYEPNDEYELCDVSIKPGNLPTEEEISQDILFENIQQQIIQEIRDAKYLIWIAVADLLIL